MTCNFGINLSNITKLTIISSLGLAVSYGFLRYKKSKSKSKNVIGIYDNSIILKENNKATQRLVKGTSKSAGWDVFPDVPEIIRPGERMLVSTGISIYHMPEDYYLRIAPRSSLSVKGIDIGAGVVDSDYRGIIKVLLINNSEDVFPVNNAIRIAQLIPEYCGNLNIEYLNADLVVDTTNTPGYSNSIRNERGDGGFGSTGE